MIDDFDAAFEAMVDRIDAGQECPRCRERRLFRLQSSGLYVWATTANAAGLDTGEIFTRGKDAA